LGKADVKGELGDDDQKTEELRKMVEKKRHDSAHKKEKGVKREKGEGECQLLVVCGVWGNGS
jgi:hypothetical protein